MKIKPRWRSSDQVRDGYGERVWGLGVEIVLSGPDPFPCPSLPWSDQGVVYFTRVINLLLYHVVCLHEFPPVLEKAKESKDYPDNILHQNF